MEETKLKALSIENPYKFDVSEFLPGMREILCFPDLGKEHVHFASAPLRQFQLFVMLHGALNLGQHRLFSILFAPQTHETGTGPLGRSGAAAAAAPVTRFSAAAAVAPRSAAIGPRLRSWHELGVVVALHRAS